MDFMVNRHSKVDRSPVGASEGAQPNSDARILAIDSI